MAKNLKTGILITGDSKGAIRALEITGDEVDGLSKKTKKSRTTHKDASKSIVGGFSDMAVNAAKWGAAAAAAGAVATAAMVKSGLSSVDALAKTSDKLGVSTEALASLRLAAEQTGVETNKFDVALQRFTRRLADAAAGTGPAVAAFDAMGLSAKELVELSPDKAFAKVADKMALVENKSQKVSLAFKLFDSEGVGLVNTLALGADGLQEMADQADTLGLTLSRVDAAKVEQANDAMNLISKAVDGFSQQLAIQFAPLLTVVADRMFGIAEEAGGMGEVASESFNSIIKGAGYLVDSIRVLEIGWISMKIGFLGAAQVIADGLDGLVSGAIDLYNKLPWVDKVQYTADFAGFARTWEDEVNKGYKEVARIMGQPMPSDALEDFTADVVREYEAQAAAAVENQDIIQGEMLDTETVTASLATTTKTATKEVVSAWDKAMQDTASRIDSAFSSAWKGAFDSFESFTTSIKDALKQTLAEMAHILLTRPLVMSVSAGFGLGTGSSAATAAGGVAAGGGGFLSTGASLLSSGFSGLGGGYQSLGMFARDMGFTGYGNAAFNTGLDYANSGVGANLLSGGLNLGAGVLGGLAGNAVYGETSGIGAAAGGFLGSAYGPIGTGIGSFIGGGIEKALANVFGQKNDGDNKGRSVIDLASGTFDIYGEGKSFNEANVEAMSSITGVIQQFAAVLGGSVSTLSISAGNNSGLNIGKESFGEDSEAFFASAFDYVIRGATGLTGSLKKLLLAFEGTTDEMLMFAGSVVSMSEQIKTNPVDEALGQYIAAQDSATDVYVKQITTIKALAKNFDGSAVAAAELNGALSINRNAAFQLASAILGVSDQMDAMFSSTAQQIRESILTDEEKISAWTKTRDELRNSLSGILDPAELQATGTEVNRLNSQIFSTLSDDAKLFSAETFARYAEDTGEVVQGQLDMALAAVESTQDQINATIDAMLRDTATRMEINTGAFALAVDKFVAATDKQEEAAIKQDEAADKNADTAIKGTAPPIDGLAVGSGIFTGQNIHNPTSGKFDFTMGEYIEYIASFDTEEVNA